MIAPITSRNFDMVVENVEMVYEMEISYAGESGRELYRLGDTGKWEEKDVYDGGWSEVFSDERSSDLHELLEKYALCQRRALGRSGYGSGWAQVIEKSVIDRLQDIDSGFIEGGPTYRDEILGRGAGPELDALVETRIFNQEVLGIVFAEPDYYQSHRWTIPYTRPPVGSDLPNSQLRPVYLRDCSCEYRQPNDSNYFGHFACCLEVVSARSTNIAAAWEVVQQMLENAYDFELYWAGPGRGFDCHFTGTGLVRGLTAPLAICRAARLAVMEMETNDEP